MTRLDLVEQVMNKFFSKVPAKQKSHEVSKESHETHETIHAETVEQAFEKPHPDKCICDECLPE